jgi:hypothetical protein
MSKIWEGNTCFYLIYWDTYLIFLLWYFRNGENWPSWTDYDNCTSLPLSQYRHRVRLGGRRVLKRLYSDNSNAYKFEVTESKVLLLLILLITIHLWFEIIDLSNFNARKPIYSKAK